MTSPGSEEKEDEAGDGLLCRVDGTPMELHLDVLPAERRALTQLVQRRGGCVVVNPARHQHAVTFSEGQPGSVTRANLLHRPDSFSTRFIYDSIETGTLGDLAQYRLQAKSIYKHPSHMMLVLFGRTKRSDLKWVDEGSGDEAEDDPDLQLLLRPTSAEVAAELGRAGTAYRHRERYTTQKDAAMVLFVAERVKWLTASPTAPRFWQSVSSRLPPELAPHSASSLWTHFIRQVLPNLKQLKQHVPLRALALVARVCDVPMPLSEEELELMRQSRPLETEVRQPADQQNSLGEAERNSELCGETAETPEETADGANGAVASPMRGVGSLAGTASAEYGSDEEHLEVDLPHSDEETEFSDRSLQSEDSIETVLREVHSDQSPTPPVSGRDPDQDHASHTATPGTLATSGSPSPPRLRMDPTPPPEDPSPRASPSASPNLRPRTCERPMTRARANAEPIHCASPGDRVGRMAREDISPRAGRSARVDPGLHPSPSARASRSPRAGPAVDTEPAAGARPAAARTSSSESSAGARPAAARTSSSESSAGARPAAARTSSSESSAGARPAAARTSSSESSAGARPAAARTSSSESSPEPSPDFRTRKRRRLRDVGNTSLLCISRVSGVGAPEQPDDSRRSSSGGRQPSDTPRRSSARRSVSAGPSAGQSRREYSAAERTALLQRLLSDTSGDTLGGNRLWKRIERERCVPGRTWQSLRQHFLVSLRPRLHEFSLSAAERARLGREVSPQQRQPQRTRAARAYRRCDDVRLLRFLIRWPRCLLGVRGREMWTMMADSEFKEERTWQSLKQRFTHYILPNLQRYKEVDVKSRAMIKKAVG